MGFIPNKENILTYLDVIREAKPRKEIFKYIFRRMRGKRLNFDRDVFITNAGGVLNCGRSMNNCTVACSRFERELTPMFDGVDVAIDIGANIGRHTVAIAKNASIVFAVEPDTDSYKLLSENIILNKLGEKVVPLNVACSDKEGEVTFFRDEFYPTSNSITVKKNDSMTEEKVKCSTVDIICKDQDIDLIKVDVEGGELDVLKGAFNTITRFEPIIIFEAWNDAAAEEIKEYLNNWDYKYTKLDEFNYLAKVDIAWGNKK